MKYAVVLVSCLLVAGCAYQTKQLKKNTQDSVQIMHESLARLSNIPDTPMHTVLKRVDVSEQNVSDMQFACNYVGWTKQEVQDFYIEEMERLGWHLQGSYVGIIPTLIFISPSSQMCIVALQDKEFVVTIIKKEE